MKTAEQILDLALRGTDTWRDDTLKAMKEIAELAFDAGSKYTAQKSIAPKREFQNPAPDKEQFLSLLFPE